MNQYQQVIQLAKQSALKKFSVLVQRMAQNSDQELAKALSVNSPTTDYMTINAARHFLQKAGNDLLQNLEDLYRQKLEQALKDMYSNEHVEVSQIRVSALSLIDDKTIDDQIEVGHMVGRLTASCSESLGRVNFIISQLIEKPDVREKDNPFRPELIAHTLYSVMVTMVQDERVRNFLLSYSTNSLAMYLSEYYVELCEVFKSGGISPKIYTRPTSKKPYSEDPQNRPTSQKNEGGRNGDQAASGGAGAGDPGGANSFPGSVAPDVFPGLERLLRLMQPQMMGTPQNPLLPVPADSVQVNPLTAFGALVSNLMQGAPQGQAGFTGGAGQAGAYPGGPAGVSSQLLERLNQLQDLIASGRGGGPEAVSLGNQLFASGAGPDDGTASQSERMAIELVAVLFELIHRDAQIPQGLRDQIGQLQIPFSKSAILDPDTLQQVDHPTRQLLNHMGMVSVGLPTDTEYGQEVSSEIKRIVQKILADFGEDTGIFTTCLEELKKFMGEEMSRVDAEIKRYVVAMEEVQRINNLTYGISTAVSELLLPMNLDQHVVDFCLNTWVHVLVKASTKIMKARGDDAKSTRSQLLLFFNALPDLVWSSQQKTSTEDRLTLIRLLPKLVKIIKSGMKALRLSDEESKQALDKLLAIHAQVLANNELNPTQKLPTLMELRQTFKVEVIQEKAVASKAIAPPSLDGRFIEAALAKRGVDAEVRISTVDGYSSNVEQEWLADMQVGTRIEYKDYGEYQFGRLIWVGRQQSLFMFKLDNSPKPLVYCPVYLSKALRTGTLTFVETAPTFERAVATLLQQAESLKKNHVM